MVVSQASGSLVGKTLTAVKQYSPKLREAIPDLSCLIGLKVKSVERKSKYILFDFTEYKLLIHLGMTGQFFKSTNSTLNKHDHVYFEFEDIIVKYNDKRRFGIIKIYKNDETIKEFSKIGIDPLSDSFTLNSFLNLLNTNKKIKDFLIDQSMVCGIGNAYCSEILFESKLNPEILTKEISQMQAQALYNSILSQLHKGIKLGGISMKDYIHFDQSKGTMQDNFLVYKKQDTPCLCCGNEIIMKKLSGRSTYYCPNCQK